MYLIENKTNYSYPGQLDAIVERFHAASGVHCSIASAKDTLVCPYTDRDLCSPFCYQCFAQNAHMTGEELSDSRFVFMEPHFISCRRYLYRWIASARIGGEFYYIISELVRVKRDAEEIQREISGQGDVTVFSGKSISETPFIEIHQAKAYGQILKSVIDICISSGFRDYNEALEAEAAIVRAMKTSADTKVGDRDLSESLLMSESRKSQKDKVNSLNKAISDIISCASNLDREGADRIVDELLDHGGLSEAFESEFLTETAPSGKKEEIISAASAYAVGVISLLGQAVAESAIFYHDNEMFLLYQAFLTEIRQQRTLAGIRSCLKLYFNGYWDELMSSGAEYLHKGDAAQIIDYIQQNYDNPNLSVSTIAEAFNMSVSHLTKVFKQKTGLTLKYYITESRMNAAASMLLNSSYTIGEIAERTGFLTSQAFRKAFHQHYYVSPSEFRRFNKLQ